MPKEYLILLNKEWDCELADWVYANKSNFLWLLNLSRAVCEEYIFRYGQVHPLAFHFLHLTVPSILPDEHETKQPYADEGQGVVKVESTVENYRSLYKIVKHDMCSWSFRLPPEWFTLEPYKYFLGDKEVYHNLMEAKYVRGLRKEDVSK
jgi:hypothetical protein